MRFFLDTEFVESGPGSPIYLLSIGIVDERGRTYYAIDASAPQDKANEWVRANVLPMIRKDYTQYAKPRHQIRNEIQAFVDSAGVEPKFYGRHVAYDWVVFCQIFGAMTELPAGWPKMAFDLKQYELMLGIAEVPKQTTQEHQALNDAERVKTVYEFIVNESRKRGFDLNL